MQRYFEAFSTHAHTHAHTCVYKIRKTHTYGILRNPSYSSVQFDNVFLSSNLLSRFYRVIFVEAHPIRWQRKYTYVLLLFSRSVEDIGQEAFQFRVVYIAPMIQNGLT